MRRNNPKVGDVVELGIIVAIGVVALGAISRMGVNIPNALGFHDTSGIGVAWGIVNHPLESISNALTGYAYTGPVILQTGYPGVISEPGHAAAGEQIISYPPTYGPGYAYVGVQPAGFVPPSGGQHP